MEDTKDVYYCEDCLSLNIQGDDDYMFCADCQSGHINEALFETWEAKYQLKYGRKFIDR